VLAPRSIGRRRRRRRRRRGIPNYGEQN